MSEEILKALMQLFAIISKQDEGTSSEERLYVERFLQLQLPEDAIQEYLALFDKKAGIDKAKMARKKAEGEESEAGDEKKKKRKLTSVGDSVRTLGICKKINKTLTQRQKIVVLVRLFELINAEQKITEQRVAIIETAAQVFNIEKNEYEAIEAFVLKENLADLNRTDLLLATAEELTEESEAKHILSANLDGQIVILKVLSVDLYFMKYIGSHEVKLNGRTISNANIYLFANGSTIRPAKGQAIYYSDVVARYMTDETAVSLSFNVKDLQYRFPNGAIGLHEVNLSETHGKLVGLMGASGAGKTTLLNVMAGMYSPSDGAVLLNGVNLHENPDQVDGVIGYIPQDDLLIEELSVFQNLFYNAKLCLGHLSVKEMTKAVLRVLGSLGLADIKDLRVGSPLDKTISGGQRKRLNIALELIREPSVLFVDEPTSGLSSRDSENVMDLLRELTLKGKLIFVVIHQPSSDIYKMFDKIVLLDTGGWQIYSGNPVEAIDYFKRIDHQINAFEGECPVCGNVNPEQLFNIVEAKVVDDYGRFTDKRKITSEAWHELYHENHEKKHKEDVSEKPPRSLHRPSKLKQFAIFLTRDVLSKAGNKQYVYLNLLIAPVLAFVLSIIIRYSSSDGEYIFRQNDNIPAYIFMCIIVAMFIGLTVSAEEIYRDQKILKRESFLNLSRQSYLLSKIAILFGLSAIQALLLTMIGNTILGLSGMYFHFWAMLFTVSCFSNTLGLNISSSFNSPVTIYILIPIILIPQMILGGAMFDFDKLNRVLGGEGKVPVLADVMAARWAYEGLIVNQFMENEFDKTFYEIEKSRGKYEYHSSYYIQELQSILRDVEDDWGSDDPAIRDQITNDLELLRNELHLELEDTLVQADTEFTHALVDQMTMESLTPELIEQADEYLQGIAGLCNFKLNLAIGRQEGLSNRLQSDDDKRNKFIKIRDAFSNDYLTVLVEKTAADRKIVRDGNRLVRIIHPIYHEAQADHALDFRAHFYAPNKRIFNSSFSTYWFNLGVLWTMTIVLYLTLYFDVLKKVLNVFNKFRFNKR